MKRKLHVEPAAEREVEEAAEWYEERETGLGAAFVAAFRKALARIAAAPETFAPVADVDIEPPVRSASMKPYSYRVVYVTEPTRLRVISVTHTRRSAHWLGRIAPSEDRPSG